MMGTNAQYIGAVTALLVLVALIVYLSAGAYFYYRKFDLALELTQHPLARGRTRNEMSLYEIGTICTTLVIWLAFPKANFWPMSNIHALFRHVDPNKIPRSIKAPLFLTFRAMWGGCLILLIGNQLRSMYL